MLGTSDFAVLIVGPDTVAAADFDTMAAAGVDSGTVPGYRYLLFGTYNCYHPYDYRMLQKTDVLVQDCCNFYSHARKIHESSSIFSLDVFHEIRFLHFFLPGFGFDYFLVEEWYVKILLIIHLNLHILDCLVELLHLGH